MSLPLHGKVALVSGAGKNIGRAIALALARDGASIVVNGRADKVAVDGVVREIEAAGGKAMAALGDVADPAVPPRLAVEAAARFGGVDILVSNAGIQIVKPLVDFPFADWKKLLSIHLDGAFLTTKACLKHMYAAKYGRVVYMGSVHSKEASKLKAPYVTAKHGLIGLAKVLAKEGAEFNVSANVVCPGFVRTPLVDKQIPEQAKELNISEDEVIKHVMLKDTVDGQFTTTDEVADAVLYFAGAKSTALTGQSMVVSHGWFMQ
jgi:3-hydroxybutyrate dehydrogenase